MKRFILFFSIFLLIPSVVFGAEFSSEDYENTLSNFDLSSFEDNLDDDTKEVLEDMGLTSFDYTTITQLSINDVFDIIKSILEGKIEGPLKSSIIVLILIIISCFLKSFSSNENENLSSVYSTVTVLVISTIIMVKLTSTISLCAMSIGVAADFVYAFFPVFCSIVIASGGVTTGFSTNTTLLILSQILSFIASNVFLPVINSFLAIGICSSLREDLNLNKVVVTFRKIITFCISFIFAIFISVLSIKTAVSSRADILGIRSIRFAINTVVPVIGSSISEGLLSIQSYSSLIKSSVGIVGIIAITLVFLPSIIEVLIWRLCFSICSIISDVFGDKSVSLALYSFKDTMLLTNVVLVLSMVTTIISIGILVAAGGGK